ncbi:acetyl-CoA carboxylase, carboxyltransferase subunit beta [Marinilongibacter aquaticus]|uniref:acetyl-CoA carboxylase, carboxyltransferase subunit beta n=1 Tax=Marinilongibacter aquaticus TaxID=2975157 RepID=UPI0021BD366D|nr:acetyl-CoA carboxylase, carboxyltransferase subunit beta [Marinilongibacter aquaticus]UBM57503.1 acetyl-CoA carboxylase, carboxyltransferase subunit beta [Marinilongibacter aquaticus]
MSWFQRKAKGINTPTELKRETPDGLWHQCSECKQIMHTREHKNNAYTCIHCNHHDKIGSEAYFKLLFDDQQFTELDPEMRSADPLEFVDTKAYPDRIKQTELKSGLKDACRTAEGKLYGSDITISCMDFGFIGGSMGSVVGEKIARGIQNSLNKKIPFLMISKSGGARMMEAGYSLMQMAKTSARLAQLDEAKIPYISLLTDPTTGGVTASFAMLGDFNIAEPGSLIGFAGPRIIKETIGKDLPEGFQTAEFILEKGFLDFIVDRKDLKDKLASLLTMLDKRKK